MTPTTPSLRRHEKRVAALIADPDVGGDLLLIGIGLSRYVDLRDPEFRGFSDVARKMLRSRPPGNPRLGAAHVERMAFHRLNDVLRADRRRYDPIDGYTGRCCKPVKRLSGETTPCGTGAQQMAWLTDWVTGERRMIGGCKPHLGWYKAARAANEAEGEGLERPEPAANLGGVLARHFPELDWEKVWLHYDPKWKPPHEETWRPPRLALIEGNDEEQEPASLTEPPALQIIAGGWT